MEWLPILLFLPGDLHGQRSLVDYSPWGCKELDMTERLNHTVSSNRSIISCFHWHVWVKNCFSPRNVNIIKTFSVLWKEGIEMKFFPGNSWGKLLLKDPDIIFRLSMCQDWKILLEEWCRLLFHLHYFVFNGCFWEARCLFRHLSCDWLLHFTPS